MSGFAKLLRFLTFGGLGFVVDAGTLVTLHDGFGVGPYSARCVAILLATLLTWRLNRALTFGASRHGQAGEGLRYAFVAAVAAGVNWLVYAGAVYLFGLPPLIALPLGVIAAMSVTFTGYDRLVFGSR